MEELKLRSYAEIRDEVLEKLKLRPYAKIRDERELRLRQIEERDLPRLRDWRNKDEIRECCREYRLLNMVNQREWFQYMSTNRGVEMFGIVRGDSLIGVCGLCNINWVNRTAEVSLYIGPEELRGQGLGERVLQMLETKAFREFNLHRLWAEVYEFNITSMTLFESCGYEKEGVLRQHIFAQGCYWDSIVYGLLC